MVSSKLGVLGAEARNQSIDEGTLARTNSPLPGLMLLFMDNRIRVVLFIVLLFGVSMISDFFNNAWCLLTGRGFVIPKASSIFTFRATLMNQGSGEWWVYGEDGNFFYYFTGEDETPYLKIAKVESSKCSAFAPLNIATWCSIKY